MQTATSIMQMPTAYCFGLQEETRQPDIKITWWKTSEAQGRTQGGGGNRNPNV